MGKSGKKWYFCFQVEKRVKMFRGSDPINMDAKGRMAIPTRYRALLDRICSSDLVITIDMKSTCLTLSPLPEWKKFEEKVAAFLLWMSLVKC